MLRPQPTPSLCQASDIEVSDMKLTFGATHTQKSLLGRGIPLFLLKGLVDNREKGE